jgi:trehalose 6-phosphate synthase/phosphatase
MKIINISNRLPVSISRKNTEVTIGRSSGGLVSAVESLGKSGQELHWVGVADFTKLDWLEAKDNYSGGFQLHPIFIEDKLYKLYYTGFSNSVLWPLFHYFPSFVEFKRNAFDAYHEVNRTIAESIQYLIDKDDVIWIHDYHLLPLASFIRELVPTAKIGFFLHIPFPSYELIRILPKDCRDAIIKGMLGADIIGFHTYDYAQHFAESVQMIGGIQHKNFELNVKDRLVKIEVFPISIEYQKYNEAYDLPEVVLNRERVESQYEGKKIIFSVDRLDYSKGILYRLRGYARFLEKYPQWKEKVVFILVAVPSRNSISKYEERKELIERMVGLINGKYGNFNWTPIVYQYGSLDFGELIGLYTSCDVALISPVRDGMNLVAKEFVASRKDLKGVLMLSDMTGAAKELSRALMFNPFDEHEVAEKINIALSMTENDQKERLTYLQNQIKKNDIFKWGTDFVQSIQNISSLASKSKKIEPLDRVAIISNFQACKRRLIVLDYDGTLVEHKPTPELAIPDELVMMVIHKLVEKPNNSLVIISGRDTSFLDKWFGHFPITMIAEHGLYFKEYKKEWQCLHDDDLPWYKKVLAIMNTFANNCPGAFVEEKSKSLSWHYRNSEKEIGFSQSRELINLLSNFLISTNANILDGNKVIEVKPTNLNKGIALGNFHAQSEYDFTLCIGDDKTDEDMFTVVNELPYGISIKVGPGNTIAKHRLDNVSQVLSFLNVLQ